MARENLAEALRRVERNAGAPGIDGMSSKELRPWLEGHWPQVRSQLDAGIYRPASVRRVMIPKPSGGMRMLGVPTVLDRLIQQAVSQVLTPVFDPYFHPHSFGFRPGCSAHEAVERARQSIANRFTVGWSAYYSLAEGERPFSDLDEWLRRRLRQVRWKEWKRYRTRRRNLRALGIPDRSAREWAGSGKGYWRIAGSYVLSRALPNAYWVEHGLRGFTDPYRRFREC